MTDQKELTILLKNYATELGADIVGTASVERWSQAPLQHSPQGILPGSKSVISFGVHFLDCCVELGGNEDVRDPGPAVTTHIASEHANYIGYKLVKFIQDKGYRAVAIPATLWWSYRPREGAPRGWIGDLSNYYAAVACGLGEIGWQNICLTYKFGPRQRFATVITDAVIDTDPMYSGEPLCDKCMLCAKNCPMDTFNKETNGMIEINYNNERIFTFPNRNLWRCAVGENFHLDVKSQWPDKINEQVIEYFSEVAVTTNPDLLKTWKMGMCLKYCVPPTRRYFDKRFSKSPRRRRDAKPNMNKANIRQVFNEMVIKGKKIGVDMIAVAGVETCNQNGIFLEKYLPGAQSVIVVGQGCPENFIQNSMNFSALLNHNVHPNLDNESDEDSTDGYRTPDQVGVDANWLVSRNALWIARIIQERFGFDVVMETKLDRNSAVTATEIAVQDNDGNILTERYGKRQVWSTPLITNIPFSETFSWVRENNDLDTRDIESREKLTQRIKELAYKEDTDLIGIAPVSRLNNIINQLDELFSEKSFIFYEKGFGPGAKDMEYLKGKPHSPEKVDVNIKPNRVSDYMTEAKSVIVVGVRLPDASIDVAAKPPAYKAGHYAAHVHKESFYQLQAILLRLGKYLEDISYKSFPIIDLEGLASEVYSNRQVDLTASRFAAVAAGLGESGWNGLVLTPEFGARQRFAVLLTNAELEYDHVYEGDHICKKCFECVKSCPTGAISSEDSNSITIDEKTFSWGKLNRLRCDWAKRYALVGEAGPIAMGSKNNFEPPEEISEEEVQDKIMKSDKFQVYFYCPITERCFTECKAHQ